MDAQQTGFWLEREAPRLHLRELPLAEQPLHRLQQLGPGALSIAELIEVVIGTGEALGRELLARFDDLSGLARAGLDELGSVKGLGVARAARIQAALELGKRIVSASPGDAPQVRSPADAASLLLPTMSLLEQETLRVLVLDTKSCVVANVLVYQGNVNTALVRMAELFREAIRRNAPSILIAHNHPSGNPTPSPEDVRVTEEAIAAGKLLSIDLVDHVVIGNGRWLSLRERGLAFK